MNNGSLGKDDSYMLDKIALLLVIIGAINWGSIGIFSFDIVAWICGGQTAIISRIIYTLVALAGIWCILLFLRPAPGTVSAFGDQFLQSYFFHFDSVLFQFYHTESLCHNRL